MILGIVWRNLNSLMSITLWKITQKCDIIFYASNFYLESLRVGKY